MSTHQRRSRTNARQDNRDTLARDAVALAAAVVDYFGTGHIDEGLEADIALRAAAYRILATAADSD
jgi:hypothetical protein